MAGTGILPLKQAVVFLKKAPQKTSAPKTTPFPTPQPPGQKFFGYFFSKK
jgi:hypothetical protein